MPSIRHGQHLVPAGLLQRLREVFFGPKPSSDPARSSSRLAPTLRATSMPQEPLSQRRLAQGNPATLLTPGEAFTPTQPKSGRRRLIGRKEELLRILQALREDQAHVVLYAERGRGKTSLANLVIEVLRRSGSIVARHTCDADTTYDDLMRGLVRDLPMSLLGAPASDRPEQVFAVEGGGCAAALPAGALRPGDILALPQRLNCRNLVFVIDEFDRVMDGATRTRLADTIKQLSDRSVPLLFMIVGVSDTLEQILGQHPSIQRSVVGVHLPLFSDEEVGELVAEGGRAAGLRFPDAAVACVLWVSRGMPYMAQLLALRLAQAARARGDGTIVEADFEVAVQRLVAAAPAHVLALYDELSRYETDAEMMLALRRVASAPQDLYGRLRVVQLSNGSVDVAGYILSQMVWERLRASNILNEVGAESGLFAFRERGLMHHTLLLTAHDIAQGYVNERLMARQGVHVHEPVPHETMPLHPGSVAPTSRAGRMTGENL